MPTPKPTFALVLRPEEPESDDEAVGVEVAAAAVLLTGFVVAVPDFMDVCIVDEGFLVVELPPLVAFCVRLK